MKTALSALQRETAELSHKIGATTTKPVIFRSFDGEGNETGSFDLSGQQIEEIPEEAILLDVPEKPIKALLENKRHCVLYGGRAGGKSHTIALYLLSLAYAYGVKILNIREVQLSIRDSVHALLKAKIDSIPELQEFFTIYDFEIRGRNGSVFVFRGMRKESSHSIKSYEGFDLCWAEEASALSRRSIDLLIPTIRKEKSRLIWSLNPDKESDPVYIDFVLEERDDCAKAETLYTDNAFRSETVNETAERDRTKDPAKYRHVWLGGLREKGRGQIFPDYIVIPDIPLEELPFRSAKNRKSHGDMITSKFERTHGKGSVCCGLDWGHSSSHPSHVVFGWVSPRQSKIIILAEYRGIDKTLDDLAREIPEAIPILRERYIPIWCDNSRPESINHLKARGLAVKAAPKWKGSVLDGIEKLRSTRIEICASCSETIRDFSRYSWTLDANESPTGEPEKKHDHAPDALRYGVHRYIKNGSNEYQKLKNPYL